MGNAFLKDSLRQIKVTFNRFISILIISALGVAFFAGLRTTGEDMRITAEEYFNEQNFFDIHLLSNYGFNKDDINSIKNINGIEDINAVFSLDALAEANDNNLTVKLLSFDENTTINIPKLCEGRLPENSNECLADKKFLTQTDSAIGDVINLDSGNSSPITDNITCEKYTIVGVAKYPMYISYDRGTSVVGSGNNDAFLIIPTYNFKISVYTDVYIAVNNPQKLSRFDDEYDNLINPVVHSLEDNGNIRSEIRYKEIIQEASDEINSAKSDVENGYTELEDGRIKIEQARNELDEGWAEYNQNKDDFNKTIEESNIKLEKGKKEYENGLLEYNKGKTLFNTISSLYTLEKNANAITAIYNLASDLKSSNSDLSELLFAYASEPENEIYKTAVKSAIDNLGSSFEQSKVILDRTKTELSNSEEKLKLANQDGQTQFDEAHIKLNDSEKEYFEASEKYGTEKEKAIRELTKAKTDIADAEIELSNLKLTDWYVLDHNTNIGFVSYIQDTDRLDALSLVIPLLFFMIAVLVNMTSMTRLVESDRSFIGTLKSMGYKNGTIATRYLFYSVSASVLGGALGLFAGYNIFPRVIFDSYSIMYTLPEIQIVYSNFYSFISVSTAVICAALPAYLVCIKSLKASASELMRPVSPNIGKRSVIERITPLWKRLNFSQKVAFRNLFRYKKRLIMTLIGVAGCTSLMFTGFGLRDSITTIVEKQYSVLHKYDMQIFYSSDEESNISDIIKENKSISDYALVYEDSCEIVSDKKTTSVELIVPENTENFYSFLTLQTRKNKKPLLLDDNGVIITEKLSSIYDLSIGDSFSVRDSNGITVNLTITGITENYLLHYIYISPTLYNKHFSKESNSNEILCKTAKGTDEKQFAEKMLSYPTVKSVSISKTLEKNFSKMIDALRYVVLILIASAATLVFVVLFSLNTINLEERKRELATIKVLGFYNSELAAYIYRENAFLTLFGTLLGLGFGVLLQRYIITTMEVDMLMFSRDLLWQSYVFSAVLTLLFAAIVNLIMLKSIAKIDVVTSMKSIE